MEIIDLIYLIVGVLACLLFIVFSYSSFHEKKPRAALISFVFLMAFGVFWFGVYLMFNPDSSYLLIQTSLVIFFYLLFFMPLGRKSSIRIGTITDRVDERDVIFAREEYEQGTEKYDKYYTAHPELKQIDDQIRRLPGFLKPGSRFYDPVQSAYIDSIFESIRQLTGLVDGKIAENQQKIDRAAITQAIKRLVKNQGANDVGIAQLNPMYVYSNVGRGPETWGAPIINNHRFAIVFTLEMRYDYVDQAPHLPITEESALQYLNGASISISVAEFIRQLGYSARAHISGSNYQIMLPPVAYDAGLGELARLGYLISPRLGARVRLGAVTTDLPLVLDKPINFGVQDFCAKCLKCAANCPSGAITKGSKINARGIEKWPLDIEKCIRYWRSIGTDCGLCMKVCPYSHPPTLVHNLVRSGIKRSSFARTVSIYADDLFYGRKVGY